MKTTARAQQALTLTVQQHALLRRLYTAGSFGAYLTQSEVDLLLRLAFIEGAGPANVYRLTKLGADTYRGPR